MPYVQLSFYPHCPASSIMRLCSVHAAVAPTCGHLQSLTVDRAAFYCASCCCCAWPQVITRILQSSSAPVKLRATDILLSALAHDPSPLRSFLAAQPGHLLLDCLAKEFVGSEQSGLPEQIAELLKLLVDPGGLAVGLCWLF
jgi:hypothetical protein